MAFLKLTKQIDPTSHHRPQLHQNSLTPPYYLLLLFTFNFINIHHQTTCSLALFDSTLICPSIQILIQTQKQKKQRTMFFTFFTLFFTLIPTFLGLANPNPATIQSFLPNPSPLATIPAFPEQSNVIGCPLDLSDQLFHGIKTACGDSSSSDHLKRTRCCPVLAAWLYSAYSATALGRAGKEVVGRGSSSYDLPLLPDDSETCVADLDKATKARGIELVKPNETCNLVYCYCGIRLRPLSCPEAFSINQKGKLVGGKNVKRLERNCLSSSRDVNGFPGLGGCSKCLNSLSLLTKKSLNSSKIEDRTTKMHQKDCQLMGLTWLLAKNRTAYIHTVSAVLRAIMLSSDGSDPQSCTLSSDGMPLAVDSSEFFDDSSSTNLGVTVSFCMVSVSLLFMHFTMWSMFQN